MAKTNVAQKYTEKTHEGAPAARMNPAQALRRSVMACLLWDQTFYEDGEDIASRIAELVPQVDPLLVREFAIEARSRMKLRHVPLLLVREMARHSTHRQYVASTLHEVIQRADEPGEFLSLYWKDKRQPISAQVKRGLAQAMTKFDAYQLAKYNRDAAVSLRDVLFLTHAKPKDEEQAVIWKQLVDGKLAAPDTWEVALSGGKGKRETWERLISENKLGALALLRNLRNMQQAGVPEDVIRGAILSMRTERVLPFRFLSAAKYAPSLEPELEQAMYKCLEGKGRLAGKTVLLVDVSGSMEDKVSGKSELQRWEAAAGLAILLREMGEKVHIYTFDMGCRLVPARHGFALRDAIGREVGGGTYLGAAVKAVCDNDTFDRLIVLTDEQSHDRVPVPTQGRAYMVNVAAYKNGVGYGGWVHIDGWSEAILDYILEYESAES